MTVQITKVIRIVESLLDETVREEPANKPQLSDPPPDETDVLIIGSGFGGSVMAAVLAKAERKVCVVERGKAYPPGAFPRDPAGVSRNFWDPSEGLYGMFDVWNFKGIDAIVSSGLGGGSLIYANVMLRKDKTWFTQKSPDWDYNETWRFNQDDLEPHYTEILKFLRVQELPHNTDKERVGPDFELTKTRLFLEPIGKGKGEYAPLAVRFRDGNGTPAVGAPLPPEEYGNIHGTPRRTTCRLHGECDVGCNEGAKSSLDHTYLSYAWAEGASIHTFAEVTAIAPRLDDSGGYLFDVDLRLHRPPEAQWDKDIPPAYPPDRGDPEITPHRIRARRVVLAAGSLGSTFLLLRSRKALGLDHPALGQRFCGNGDMLGFVRGAPSNLDCTKGPVITAYRRYDADTDTGKPDDHGIYIEDAGYPAFAAWLAQSSQFFGLIERIIWQVWRKWRSPLDTNLSAELNAVLDNGKFSATFMPLLGMGRDTPDGQLYLDKGDDKTLQSSWTIKTSRMYIEAVEGRMKEIAKAMRGRFGSNLMYRSILRRLLTVHPVGGCPTDTDHFEGVVDTFGRVRGVPGLRVCDGAVFPGPIGPNPSLTIAAFARRSAYNLLEEENFADPPPPADDYA
jgi:cholesterol oxidase